MFLVAKHDFSQAYAYAGSKEATYSKTLIEYEGWAYDQNLATGGTGKYPVEKIFTFIGS